MWQPQPSLYCTYSTVCINRPSQEVHTHSRTVVHSSTLSVLFCCYASYSFAYNTVICLTVSNFIILCSSSKIPVLVHQSTVLCTRTFSEKTSTMWRKYSTIIFLNTIYLEVRNIMILLFLYSFILYLSSSAYKFQGPSIFKLKHLNGNVESETFSLSKKLPVTVLSGFV